MSEPALPITDDLITRIEIAEGFATQWRAAVGSVSTDDIGDAMANSQMARQAVIEIQRAIMRLEHLIRTGEELDSLPGDEIVP